MPLFRLLFVLFLAIPLIEIYLLIQVGSIIGAWPTVLLVVATALIGVSLLRLQGIATLLRVQAALAAGELPTMAMLEGAVLLVAGALLLTPGFFTDALGFAALVPPWRQALVRFILRRATVSMMARPGGESRHSRTIDGDYTRLDD